MNDDPNLDDLATAWKEIDMQPLELALDTGRLRRKGTTSLALMGLLSAGLITFFGWWLLLGPSTFVTRLPIAAILALVIGPFAVFFHQQWRRTQGADALLLGSPAELVRGRVVLLEIELIAWRGPIARFFELVVGPACLLFGWLLAWQGGTPLLMVPATLGLVAFSAYGRLRRVPALQAEVASLEALADTLGT